MADGQPNYSILLTAVRASGSPTAAVGDIEVGDGTGKYVLSTTANRGTKRSEHIVIGPGNPVGNNAVQSAGTVSPTVSGLGAGTASWLRVSATGRLERVTPAGSDDVVGWCETDGTAHLCFGFLTAAIVNGGGGGSVPTGTGFRHITGGVEDGAAALVVNADVAAAAAIALSKLGWGAADEVVTTNTGATALQSRKIVDANVAAGAAIALSKIVNPTGTGLVKATAGVLDAATSLLVNADVNAAAAIVGTKISPNFGSQDVITTGKFQGGTTPATAGVFNAPNNTVALQVRNAGNTANHDCVKISAADVLTFGNLSANMGQVNFDVNGAYAHTFEDQSVYRLILTASEIAAAQPIVGYTGSSAPYGVHGKADQAMADANQTPANTVYKFGKIKCTGALTAGRTLTLPNPSSDARSYMIEIENATTGGFAITVSVGAGATIAVAASRTAQVVCAPSNVFRRTADSLLT